MSENPRGKPPRKTPIRKITMEVKGNTQALFKELAKLNSLSQPDMFAKLVRDATDRKPTIWK